jgi:gluconokinase
MHTSYGKPGTLAQPLASTRQGRGIQVVVMGVAGCGKSAVAQRMAARLALPLVEGDDFHPVSNIVKMQQGIAVTSDDRAQWLYTLITELARHSEGMVLTCSALKAIYRSTLRAAAPGLCFVHLAITQAESLKRVGHRPGHFYPPILVASQFDALQHPAGEYGVLSLQADAPLDALAQKAVAWLTAFEFNNA